MRAHMQIRVQYTVIYSNVLVENSYNFIRWYVEVYAKIERQNEILIYLSYINVELKNVYSLDATSCDSQWRSGCGGCGLVVVVIRRTQHSPNRMMHCWRSSSSHSSRFVRPTGSSVNSRVVAAAAALRLLVLVVSLARRVIAGGHRCGHVVLVAAVQILCVMLASVSSHPRAAAHCRSRSRLPTHVIASGLLFSQVTTQAK